MTMKHPEQAMLVGVLILGFFCISCISSHEIKYRLNQEAAINTMKQIRQAQISFKKNEKRYGTIAELVRTGLLSKELEEGESNGFTFKIIPDENSYKATAVPKKYSPKFSESSGAMSLYLDETGVIRKAFREGKEAIASDEAL